MTQVWVWNCHSLQKLGFFRYGRLEGASCLWQGWGFFNNSRNVWFPRSLLFVHIIIISTSMIRLSYPLTMWSEFYPEWSLTLKALSDSSTGETASPPSKSKEENPFLVVKCLQKSLILGRRSGRMGTSWSQSKRWSWPLVWWRVRLSRRLGDLSCIHPFYLFHL